ncbi:MAG: endo alpha-1,4 polygalactosaminidase [Nitrospinae bacterium]|nr:endo alpha-1,4 polygalactosaminidase [Nitrospinota bacterium]
MRRQHIGIFLLALLLPFLTSYSDSSYAAEKTSWVVYYSDRAALEELIKYDLLVFDSEVHPPLDPLTDRDKILLGYISLGEVEDYRYYFNDVKSDGILLQENKNWKGSYFADIRSRLWVSRVIEQMIPDILRRGFDGLFIDTLDNPIYLENEDPEKYRGMKDAAVRLVRSIRLHYPSIKIMINRAYEILPEVGLYIDMVLGESMFTDYDFEKKSYYVVPIYRYQSQVNLLKDVKKRMPHLKIFTLDYWETSDISGIVRIYKEQRANGFEPYVATIELDRIVSEPK